MTNKKWTVEDIPDGSDALAGAFAASAYYSGMMSALYAMTSTGCLELYPGEGLSRIISEVSEAVQIAEREYNDDRDDLNAFLLWLESQESAVA